MHREPEEDGLRMQQDMNGEPGMDSGRGSRATGRQLIVACPDGPLLVRGDFDIVDPDGKPVPRNRKTVALCRCGASIFKPYCDGTHKLIGFKTGDIEDEG